MDEHNNDHHCRADMAVEMFLSVVSRMNENDIYRLSINQEDRFKKLFRLCLDSIDEACQRFQEE